MAKVICLPYNKGHLKQARVDLAPKEILKFRNEFYATEEGKQINFDVEEIRLDASDFLKFQNNLVDLLFQKFKDSGEKIILLGGDHSLSYSSIKAFYNLKGSKGIIWVDAHADATNYFKPVSHEDVVKVLIKEDVDASDFFMVAIRDYDPNEYEFIRKHVKHVYRAGDIARIGFKNFLKELEEFAESRSKVYVSFDIDAIDPAFAPGTYYAEPGGLTSRQAIEIVSLLGNYASFMDLVEVEPRLDVNRLTCKLAMKLLIQFL